MMECIRRIYWGDQLCYIVAGHDPNRALHDAWGEGVGETSGLAPAQG